MNNAPKPLERKFWTPGVLVMLCFMLAGAVAVVARYAGGIAYVSNLSNARPWGLWVGLDVATGVALAAGGFTTAAVAHIFGRRLYRPVVRPALLTAALGYTFVVLSLIVDIGRSWAIWKPIVHWNFNSVLFEVAMCVVLYLTVLYIEFLPIVAERYKGRVRLPGPLALLNRLANWKLKVADAALDKTMWLFIILGVVLSCMHQSSLGSLMLIAPTKLHPLWYSPLLPLMFLLSAVAVGYPMVVLETTIAASSFQLDPEMEVLTPLTRITIFLLGLYLLLKTGDIIVRETWVYLLDGTYQTNSFVVEFFLGILLPWLLLLFGKVRHSRTGIFVASSLIVGGVVLNRINVFIVGYTSSVSDATYFPAPGEFFVTFGFIASLMFLYRVVVTYVPVLPGSKEVTS